MAVCDHHNSYHGRGFFSSHLLFLPLEILPDSQPYVGRGKPGEMGGRAPGKVFLSVQKRSSSGYISACFAGSCV